MPKTAVLVLHGIGNHTPGFADSMIKEVNDRLGGAAGDIVWQPCLWGGELDDREDELAHKVAPFVDKTRIRRELVMGGFGDLIAYLGTPTSASSNYRKLHSRIESSLVSLETKLRKMGEEPESTPLVIMAHSLGGYLMSNYLWDHQQNNVFAFARSPFMRCETLAHIITFGCNLPLTMMAFPPNEMQPILPFGPRVADCFSDDGRVVYGKLVKWWNYYDPDDILGFPLGPVHESYDRQVRDVSINTGGLLFAHVNYWTDNDFTRGVAERLRKVLTVQIL